VVAANVRDHERGNGMVKMREEWRECKRNAMELRGTERLRDESWRETENAKVRTKGEKTL